jgi:hypothetical protein
MSSLGVHFSIDDTTAERLLAAADDDALGDVIDEIEAVWDKDRLFESDKAWNALHRCFADGTLDQDGGEPPLNLCFFGGTALNDEPDYWVVLLDPDEVGDVARALAEVAQKGRPWLRERYDTLEFPDYPGKSDEDFEYTWKCFQGLPEFFARAASEGRNVIFTVDQ